MAGAIEQASPDNPGPRRAALLIRAEVLLDRAHFSPGVIDGRRGANLTRAVATYQAAHDLAPTGQVDAALLETLSRGDPGPVMQDHVISQDDLKGPFIGSVPRGFAAMAKLPRLGYVSPMQALAERFHMSQALLTALNPGADFSQAGTRILVARPAAADLPQVDRVEVDKAANQLRAFDAGGRLIAAFPATVGSIERPAPAGTWAVASVTADPNYTYDPSRLTFGPKSKGRLTIMPGPNNPVGTTWIALTAPTYGIHGAPEPNLVGKTASHGCVRLTNWMLRPWGGRSPKARRWFSSARRRRAEVWGRARRVP
ncbi:MAG: L,D-transpeptidase family protein [Caulobacteraceae bacterium]